MVLDNNISLIRDIEKYLDVAMPLRLGINKRNELVRLIYEIIAAKGISLKDIMDCTDMKAVFADGRNGAFHKVKALLLKHRYPSISDLQGVRIMPYRSDLPHEECVSWAAEIIPERIFVEKQVEGREWTRRLIGRFPHAEVYSITSLKEALEAINTADRGDGLTSYNARRRSIFLTENKASFIKICPCTDGARRCGYWILNLGFGCPMDCSYCYLQSYANMPALILPANVEDYDVHVRAFDRKLPRITRIGTGEFTDSLYLDKYTNYSGTLIDMFRDSRRALLELKTKTADIDNILGKEPHGKVVISWSLNSLEMAERYEKGAISPIERIEAAARVAGRGYNIGFHFDPIIFYDGWEDGYGRIIREMFSREVIREKTVWISLGTMRYTPGLKQFAERRFSDNGLYYEGEFFTDFDGKFRYPEEVRMDIYGKMIDWISSYRTGTWVYLCMEPGSMWEKLGIRCEPCQF